MNSPIRLLVVVIGCFVIGAFSSIAAEFPATAPTPEVEKGELPSFAGDWETSYGRMSLTAEGNRIRGTYANGNEARNEIQGTQTGRTFTFTYKEPNASGEGSFYLAADGQSFTGRWVPKGTEAWGEWSGRRKPSRAGDFSGVWKTSYGPMRLIQKGDQVEGCYAFSGTSTINGVVKEGTLHLKYREPNGSTGTAEFQLDADRGLFAGKWRTTTSSVDTPWTGTRVDPEPGKQWLIVLEAHWEKSLREPEYSYGEMLRQFFTRVPSIAVRHRTFTGRKDFAQWAADLPYIAEPVVLYVSSHGEKGGITVGKEVLDGKFLGDQIRFAPNVKLVHLGACLAMAEGVPADLRKAAGSAAPPVSGYIAVADWAGSAVIDFAYLDLVLSRNMRPGEAVQVIRKNITFANDPTNPPGAIPSAGLKIVE